MDIDLLRTVVLATFVSQLFTMSVIAPRAVYLFRRELWKNYPPEQYPRLYPIGTDRIKRQQSIANVVNGIVFCVGALILLALLVTSATTTRIAYTIAWLGIVQILLRLPRWIIDLQIIRAYKSAPPPAIRSATLKSWTLWDFVPPAFVVCGIAATTLELGIAITIAFLQHGPTAVILMIVSMDLFLLFRMIRAVYQPLLPRIDPYATTEDVYLARKRRLRVLYVGSAVFAIVTTIELLAFSHVLEIRYEYIMIGISVLLQTISLLISTVVVQQLKSRDFSAYRESATGASQDLA